MVKPKSIPALVRRWRLRHDHNISTVSPALQSEAGTAVHLLDNWFDAVEVGLRERVREFIQAMIESELEMARCPSNASHTASRVQLYTVSVSGGCLAR